MSRCKTSLALQLCVLVPTLGCHLIDLVIFLDKRAAPSQVGWTPSPLTRPGFLQTLCQLFAKPGAVYRTAAGQPAAKHVITCCVRERSRENYRVRHRFCKSTNSTLTWVTSDIRSQESLLPTWITILLYLGLVLASSFSLDRWLWPLQLTVVAGVAKLTFLRTESPITRVCFSTGPWLSGENLFEPWAGGSLTSGQSPSRPGLPAARDKSRDC